MFRVFLFIVSTLAMTAMAEDPPALPDAPETPTREIHNDPQTGRNEMDGPAPAVAPSATVTKPRGEPNPQDPSTWGKVPRNAPCPCGSGKKYKHCHGSANFQPNTAAE